MKGWLGLGPSAASQAFGRRFRNPDGLEPWLAALDRTGPRHAEDECLEPESREIDRVLFGLRTSEGVPIAHLQAFPHLGPLMDKLCMEGLLQKNGGSIAPTSEGMLVADAISREILSDAAQPIR